MQTVLSLINQHGGLAELPALSPLRIDIGQGNSLVIEDCSPGPGGRQAIRLTCFIHEGRRLLRSRILLEVTDLHLLPFYLKSKDQRLHVYRFDRRRRIRQVRRDVRARIVTGLEEWDALLRIYLDAQKEVIP